MVANKEKLMDKNKRDLMKKILKPVIAVSLFLISFLKLFKYFNFS